MKNQLVETLKKRIIEHEEIKNFSFILANREQLVDINNEYEMVRLLNILQANDTDVEQLTDILDGIYTDSFCGCIDSFCGQSIEEIMNELTITHSFFETFEELVASIEENALFDQNDYDTVDEDIEFYITCSNIEYHKTHDGYVRKIYC